MESPVEPPRRFSLAIATLLFATGFLVLAWPWLSGEVTIPWDAKSQFLPQVQFLAASIARGEWPFWTPNVFAGWPQIADPQSLILSPLHLLLALAEPAPRFRDVDAVTFAYLFAGGFGIIALFRERGWHIGGAVLAALMFAFGGSAASRLQHTGQIMSLAYLALAIWLVERTFSRRSFAAALAAGVVCGLLANERDQVAMLSLYLVAGFVLTQIFARPEVGRIRRALPLLTTMAGPALVVSAMPLVMTALLAIGSNRPEISYEAAGLGSLHPADLMMLVFGNLFGASVKDAVFWGPPSFPWKQAMGPGDLFVAQNMGQIYSGIFAPLALALFAPARGSGLWGRELRFFVVGLALMLLYALGWYTPAFRAIYELVPGVALFRRPADATFLIGYLVAVITGYLVHRWLVGAVPPLAWRDRIVAGLAAAAVIGCALWLAVSVGYLRQALTPIAIGLVMVLLALVALYAARRVATRAPAMAAAVLALVAVGDLAISNGPNGSTALPPATYAAMRPDTANETIRLIKGRLAATAAPDRRDRVELIAIAYHWPNISLSHGFDHLFGQNPLRLRDFFAATGVGDTVAVPDQRTFAPLYPSYHSVFADLFGVRFIATGVPVEAIDRNLRPGDLPLIARTKDAFVYENPHALPRAMFVGGARVADFSRMLREGWPADVDPRVTVLLDHLPQSAAEAADAHGTVRILRYTNTEVVVEAESTGSGYLLLNDAWHPWWFMEVDGRPAEMLKANVLFRAAALPAGHHTVRFVFRPLAGMWRELRGLARR